MDPGVLALARTRSGTTAKLDLRQMRAEALHFADATFDAVTCFTALPYLEQPAATVEMTRVLRPGGRLVLGTVGAGYYAKHVAEGIRHGDHDAVRYGLDPMLVAAARTLRGDGVAPGSLRVWGPRSIRRLLGRHGLDVTRTARTVDPVDPNWPESYLRKPLYMIVFATKRG
jgi:SAM-dependent methyltransferase